MSSLLSLLRETAATQQEIDKAIDAGKARGLVMPERIADPWRFLAQCKRELDVLTGKAALADRIAAGGMSAGEFMEEWNALEALRTKGERHAVTG